MNYRIIPFDEVTSTNDIAMNHENNYGEGTIITARRQTAGRGQRGNKWENPENEEQNLMFSLVLEPTHIRAEHQFLISEMGALSASDAIGEVTGSNLRCGLKWPNDLYVSEKKIGGILIEHTLQGEFLTRSVIGIGINVGQTEFDPSLPNPTSIALELPGSAVTPEELLEAFCRAFDSRYIQPMEKLHSDYMERLWRNDGFYPYTDQNGPFEATIRGISPYTGELTLVDTMGQSRHYWFKEVEAVIE